MLVVTAETPPASSRVALAFDVGLEEDTEFGETPEENLLGAAARVLRDLEVAGFTASEVVRMAEHLKRMGETATGGRN